MFVAPFPKLGDKIAHDGLDAMGRVHALQPERVSKVPVGVPLPRARVGSLPEERAPARPMRRVR